MQLGNRPHELLPSSQWGQRIHSATLLQCIVECNITQRLQYFPGQRLKGPKVAVQLLQCQLVHSASEAGILTGSICKRPRLFTGGKNEVQGRNCSQCYPTSCSQIGATTYGTSKGATSSKQTQEVEEHAQPTVEPFMPYGKSLPYHNIDTGFVMSSRVGANAHKSPLIICLAAVVVGQVISSVESNRLSVLDLLYSCALLERLIKRWVPYSTGEGGYSDSIAEGV
ncbi:hypothetical protein CH06BL_21370 [Chromobacterium haemolyticum]|nr:hypothetical protein CH06BL_21370 [Chromobacterium haemolyticum]